MSSRRLTAQQRAIIRRRDEQQQAQQQQAPADGAPSLRQMRAENQERIRRERELDDATRGQ